MATPDKKTLLQAYKELRRGRRLLKDRYIKGKWGLTKDGHPLDRNQTYESAYYVCSLGALGKVANVTGAEAAKRQSACFLASAFTSTNYNHYDPHHIRDTIISANDGLGKDKTLEGWDKAIKNARSAAKAAIRPEQGDDSQ